MSSLKAIAYSKNVNKQAIPVKKIFLAGVGAVGNTFLKQVSKQQSLRVLGICNSTNVLWYDHSQKINPLRDLQKSPLKEWNTIIRKLSSYEKGSVIFVDASGTQEVANLYDELLSSGIHVVTPSKLANTRSQQIFNNLHTTAEKSCVKFHYETNVGAGLPVIGTIKNLISTGDSIVEINGAVSGTMTYLFSELDKGEPFSKSVIRARSLGYAEPDPRDDLTGEDVARKFLILGRISGFTLERSDIEVESLIPAPLKDVDSATFLERLHEFDSEWHIRLKNEKDLGNTLRYTGKLSEGKIRVGIQSVPLSSPFGRLSGTNNLIEIKSKRYFDQSMIIQGPGAGKEVTAAGVLADVLKIS
jgi:homoserine dehydrogenase